MSLRERFVSQVRQGGVQVSVLCREFGISRQTGYKWLKRYDEAGVAGLADQSRRPQHSPRQTETALEKVVSEARQRRAGVRQTRGCYELHRESPPTPDPSPTLRGGRGTLSW